ncbi:hypothetical protein DPSP01_004793 [Paraphaeosphaeria sporulosa]
MDACRAVACLRRCTPPNASLDWRRRQGGMAARVRCLDTILYANRAGMRRTSSSVSFGFAFSAARSIPATSLVSPCKAMAWANGPQLVTAPWRARCGKRHRQHQARNCDRLAW